MARAEYLPHVGSRDHIVAWLDDMLDAGSFSDLTPNGLQVPGAQAVELVVTAVSPASSCSSRRPARAPRWCSATTGCWAPLHPITSRRR
ncbi:MAG: hypothetical protein WKF40_03585 [Thermoleophilaceae bacterium]